MIPQFFVKGGSEQINFNQFDYVAGASLIYDWGNGISYPRAQGAGGITYNASSGVSAEPQATFKTGGGSAASMWSTAYSGSIAFNASSQYLVEYNSTFPTGAMSIVTVYKPVTEFQNGSLVGLQNNNGINLVVTSGSKAVTPTIWYGASGNTQATLGCSVTMGADWNMVTFTTNGLNLHTLYLNDGTTNSIDTGTYDRSLFTPSAANIRLGKNALSNNYINGIMLSYLVYPFRLSTKQIRQLWYVFRQRMTVS